MHAPYWRLSAFYFFYFATLGAVLPYWALYLADLGYTSLEIGELSALMIATKIIAPNLSGAIADRTGKSMRLIRIACFLAVLIFSGFFHHNSYLWIAVITVGFSFFWNAVLSQLEAVTLFHLAQDPHRYSQIRLWGSNGFIVAVLAIGVFIEHYSIAYLPEWIIALLAMIWLTSLLTPETQTKRQHSAGGLWKIAKQPEIFAFFIVYFLLQISHGPYYVFFSIYLTQFGYTPHAIGIFWGLAVGAEVLLMLFMRPVLRLISLRNILLASIIFAIARWLLIGIYPDSTPLLILAQLLHAATFGASHIAAIHLLHFYFGDQHLGRGQALYSSITFGAGSMFGALYSGYLWDSLGGNTIFAIAAACCTIALFFACFWVGNKKSTTAFPTTNQNTK